MELALSAVKKIYEPVPPPSGSILLSELSNAVNDIVSVSDAIASSAATPLLHNLSAIQAYAKVFIHMCRFGQVDLKQISLDQWGSKKGLNILSQLGKLYFSIVWEGTVLSALCNDSDLLPADSDFGRGECHHCAYAVRYLIRSCLPLYSLISPVAAELAKLFPKGPQAKDMDTDSNSSVGVTAAMEGLSTADMNAAGLAGIDDDTNDSCNDDASSLNKKPSAALSAQLKQMKPLQNASSRYVQAVDWLALFVCLE